MRALPFEALVGCLEYNNNSVRSVPRVVTAGCPKKFSALGVNLSDIPREFCVLGVKFSDIRRRVAPSRMQAVVFYSARAWLRQ